jgi:hypothetical protein
MFTNAVVLFCRGKLFRDFNKVVERTLIGNLIAIVLVVGLAKLGLALWIAVLVAAVISGAAQPWLFKDLKYA